MPCSLLWSIRMTGLDKRDRFHYRNNNIFLNYGKFFRGGDGLSLLYPSETAGKKPAPEYGSISINGSAFS
jgi:hypothetical protein